MKYKLDITIDLPLNRVIELFDNPDYYTHWKMGFENIETIEGQPGQAGAKSRISYGGGNSSPNGNLQLIETIKVKNLPNELSALYETKFFKNHNTHRFEELPGGRTRWINENEYQFSGFLRFLVKLLGAKKFKEQSFRNMMSFKAFAEKSGNSDKW